MFPGVKLNKMVVNEQSPIYFYVRYTGTVLAAHLVQKRNMLGVEKKSCTMFMWDTKQGTWNGFYELCVIYQLHFVQTAINMASVIHTLINHKDGLETFISTK